MKLKSKFIAIVFLLTSITVVNCRSENASKSIIMQAQVDSLEAELYKSYAHSDSLQIKLDSISAVRVIKLPKIFR